jgi:hypothetical protein
MGAFEFLTTAVPLGRGLYVGLKGAGKLGAVGARFGVPKLGALQNAATKIPKGLAGLSDDAARLSHNALRQSDELLELAGKRGAVARRWQQPRQFWNKDTIFDGNRVFQRDDLFDPNLMTSWKVRGKTVHGSNLERMATGRAPIGIDGKSVNLHHLTQTQDGAIAEVAGGMHDEFYKILHINTGQLPSGINRSLFGSWREAYWQNRILDFL